MKPFDYRAYANREEARVSKERKAERQWRLTHPDYTARALAAYSEYAERTHGDEQANWPNEIQARYRILVIENDIAKRGGT